MVECPSGWRSIRVSDGLRLLPPENPAPGEIRYRLRHPIVSIEELMARKLAPSPNFVIESVTPPERLVTDEGEYASLLLVSGRVDGKRVQRDIGMVYGDDYYALILGVVIDETRFGAFTEMVRALVLGDQQMLGTQRRRRYFFTPPPGWRESRWDFEVTFTPPDDPTLSLTILPALPSQGASKAAVARLVEANMHGRFAVARATRPEPIASRHDLSGSRWQLEGILDGNELVRVLVVLQDDRFIYPVRLETLPGRFDESRRAQLETLVSSIEPIPYPRSARTNVDALMHWVD